MLRAYEVAWREVGGDEERPLANSREMKPIGGKPDKNNLMAACVAPHDEPYCAQWRRRLAGNKSNSALSSAQS